MMMMVLIMMLFILVGDGRLGYPEEAPYDAIHVGAAAATIPKAVSTSDLHAACVLGWHVMVSNMS